MILALLKDLLGGLRVRDNWLQLGGTSLCRTFSSVRLAEAMVRTGPHVSLASEIFYSEEFPGASGSLCSTEARWTFRRERRAVAVERSSVLSN